VYKRQVDDNGEKIDVFSLDPVLYLTFPMIMALLIWRTGTTMGKRLFRLAVKNQELKNPDFRQSLLREYIKHAPLVIVAILTLVQLQQVSHLSDEEMARDMLSLADQMSSSGNFTISVVGAVAVSAVLFWFYFGSFIRWKGQAYWDRFTGLMVGKSQDFKNPSVE